MSSSTPSCDGNDPDTTTAQLCFDPEAVLLREPGVLLDARFLAVLHEDLAQDLGPEAAGRALLQMGCLQGLRDATEVIARGFNRPDASHPQASPLPLQLSQRADAPSPGAVELCGCWPERTEAEAHLSRCGPSREPACWLSAGYTSGWLSGMLGSEVLVLESRCSATGDESCSFVAREAEDWRRSGDTRAAACLDALPFGLLRELVAQHAQPPEATPDGGAIDSEEPVVHIWGPVMVVPFAGPEEALLAVELIGHDPSASAVSVIVLDLTGAVIDDAFGAATLERIVDSVESWGADVVFAGPSPLAETVVETLERQPLMVRKDLHSAIAAAFQITESQRTLL